VVVAVAAVVVVAVVEASTRPAGEATVTFVVNNAVKDRTTKTIVTAAIAIPSRPILEATVATMVVATEALTAVPAVADLAEITGGKEAMKAKEACYSTPFRWGIVI
jgi:hypothetical protein